MLPGDPSRLSPLETAYDRLRMRLAATDVTDEHSRDVALETLARTKARIEHVSQRLLGTRRFVVIWIQ